MPVRAPLYLHLCAHHAHLHPPICVCGRKRALRKMQHASRQGEADWENTTGSDNTDTEGS